MNTEGQNHSFNPEDRNQQIYTDSVIVNRTDGIAAEVQMQDVIGGDIVILTTANNDRVLLSGLLEGSETGLLFMPENMKEDGDPNDIITPPVEVDGCRNIIFDEGALQKEDAISELIVCIGLAHADKGEPTAQKATEALAGIGTSYETLTEQELDTLTEEQREHVIIFADHARRAREFSKKVVRILRNNDIDIIPGLDANALELLQDEDPIKVPRMSITKDEKAYIIEPTPSDSEVQKYFDLPGMPEFSPIESVSWRSSSEEVSPEPKAYLISTLGDAVISNIRRPVIAIPLSRETNSMQFSSTMKQEGHEYPELMIDHKIAAGRIEYKIEQNRPEGMPDGDYIIFAPKIFIGFDLDAFTQRDRRIKIESLTITGHNPATQRSFTQELLNREDI